MTASSQPQLRRASGDDAPQVRELVFRILAEHGLKSDPAQTDADLFDLEGFYLQNGGDFSVLEVGRRIVGTVALARTGPRSCELRKMYLDSAFRGRGLGKTLLFHAIETAKALGCDEITLETSSNLKSALSLYEKAGFEPYEPEHLVPRCDLALRLRLR